MTYLGEIHNGVVVLKDAPSLAEGTRVRVEIESSDSKAAVGSAAALLQHAGVWADSAEELDQALEDLKKAKWDDVRRQQEEPEDGL